MHMKLIFAILLSAIGSSGIVISAAHSSRDVQQNEFADNVKLFCTPGAKFITQMHMCFYVPMVCNMTLLDIQEVVGECKKNSGAEVFLALKAYNNTSHVVPSLFKTSVLESARIPARKASKDEVTRLEPNIDTRIFDGINYEVFEIKSKSALEKYLHGWKTEGQLALTMTVSQWAYLGEFVNENNSLFSHILVWIRNPENVAEFEELDLSTSEIKPSQKIWVTVQETETFDKVGYMDRYSWLGGFIDESLLPGKHYVFHG